MIRLQYESQAVRAQRVKGDDRLFARVILAGVFLALLVYVLVKHGWRL